MSIPECPAYSICRKAGNDCKPCLSMDLASWRQYVASVQARGT